MHLFANCRSSPSIIGMLKIVPLKSLFKRMIHNSWLHSLRNPQCTKFFKRHSVSIMPFQDCVEISALVIYTEIWNGIILRIAPEMRVYLDPRLVTPMIGYDNKTWNSHQHLQYTSHFEEVCTNNG